MVDWDTDGVANLHQLPHNVTEHIQTGAYVFVYVYVNPPHDSIKEYVNFIDFFFVQLLSQISG